MDEQNGVGVGVGGMDEHWQSFCNVSDAGSWQSAHLPGQEVKSAHGCPIPLRKESPTTTTLRRLLLGVMDVSLPAMGADGSSS